MQTGIVGYGSIGSVLADGFATLGYQPLVNDVQQDRVEFSQFEYGTLPRLAADCDAIFVAVPTPTPSLESGGDASNVVDVVTAIDDAARRQQTPPTVVIKSTMPPGESGKLASEVNLSLAYTPEFLRDRSGVEDFMDPDRIVAAGPAPARMVALDVLDDPKRSADAVIETDSYREAEIAKEAHNAFFATKVSFANQIRAICEAVEADPTTVMEVVQADRRNGPSHLDPTLGPYGGKCLPKDVRALRSYAQSMAVDDPLLAGTVSMNELAQEWPDRAVTDADQPTHSRPVTDGGQTD